MGFIRWNSPMVQVFIAAMICLSCPGMFDMLVDIGGYSHISFKAYEIGRIVMIVTSSIFSFFGASIYNIYGRFVLIPASLFYVLLIGSYLSPNGAFYIVSAALSGIGSGLLWSALISIVISYPDEKDKGKAFSLFWSIARLGDLIGAIILIAVEWNAIKIKEVKIEVYVVLMVIMAFGSLLTLLLLPSNKVKRYNGSIVSLHKPSNWKREFIEFLCLFKNWRLLILIPLFFSSNWFQNYQFKTYNTYMYMTFRDQAINNILYALFQIIGSISIGFLLDTKTIGFRKKRGIIGTTIVLVFTIAFCIGCVFVQRSMDNDFNNHVHVDIYDKSYPGRATLYGFFGILDSLQQGLIYWLLGTMTNDTEHAVRYCGFYKAFQIAAGAISKQLPYYKIGAITQLAITFATIIASLLLSYAFSIKITDVTIEKIDNLINGDQDVIMVGGKIQETEYIEEASNVKNQV